MRFKLNKVKRLSVATFETGMTLIELLVAAFLATMLLTGLTVLYLNLKNNYELQEAYARLQESAQFITTLFSERVHMAGLGTCQSQNSVIVPGVVGYDSDNLPDFLKGEVKENTNALVVTSCMSNTSMSENLKLTQMGYFIGDSNRTNSQNKEIYSLYQKPSGGNRQELVAGVSELQLEFGVMAASNHNISAYINTEQVKDWSKIASVQIHLLLNSIEPTIHSDYLVYFQQKWFSVEDHLLYVPWNVYVLLRE